MKLGNTSERRHAQRPKDALSTRTHRLRVANDQARLSRKPGRVSVGGFASAKWPDQRKPPFAAKVGISVLMGAGLVAGGLLFARAAHHR
jgi:hypothetical protein